LQRATHGGDLDRVCEHRHERQIKSVHPARVPELGSLRRRQSR
jgi:hypothetical protein